MTNNINTGDQTLQGGESGKNEEIGQISQKTQNEILEEISNFKRKISYTNKSNRSKLDDEFRKADESIKGSKEIINMMIDLPYEVNSLGDAVLAYATVNLLNDTEFLLNIIKKGHSVLKYLGYKDDNGKIKSLLINDKEFVLKAIDAVNTYRDNNRQEREFGPMWKYLSDDLKQDTDIINHLLQSKSYSEVPKFILEYLIKSDSQLLQNKELMKKIVAGAGGHNRHKYPESIRDDGQLLLAVYKKRGPESFYSFDDDFKRTNSDYYPNLVKKAQELISNNEKEILNCIEENPLEAKNIKVDNIINKIDSKCLNDNVFMLKLLYADPNLYDKIQHPKKYLFKNLVNFLKQKSNKWNDCLCDGTIDIDSEHGIMSYINGTVKTGQVCEYGNNVIVWYNGEEQREHVVYRVAHHDSSRDNRGLCFNKTKIISIKEENKNIIIIVEASSDTEKRKYTFSFLKTSLPEEINSNKVVELN